MKLFPTLALACMMACVVACGNTTSSTAAISDVPDSSGAGVQALAGEADAKDSPSEEPRHPNPKADSEIAALKKQWEAAIAAEKKFLGNPQLEQWIAALKEGEDEDGMPVHGKLDPAQFDGLDAKGLLYYTLFHPENWDQICAEFMFEAGYVQAISPNLPIEGDYSSDRQSKAMKTKWDAIQPLILDCIKTNNTVSQPMMHVVAEYDVRAAILPLTAIYKAGKPQDDLILSTFIEMMENAKYPEWLNSETRKHVIDVWTEWMPLTSANADKIIFYAKKFADA